MFIPDIFNLKPSSVEKEKTAVQQRLEQSNL